MSRLSLNYQQSHDIDWFAHVGDVFIHAMSFGGKLPEEVNDWRLLCEMIVKAYHLETIINEGKNLNYNDHYIDSRLMMQFDNDKPNETERREIRDLASHLAFLRSAKRVCAVRRHYYSANLRL